MTEKSEGDWRAGRNRGKKYRAFGAGFHAHLGGARASNRSDALVGRAVQAGQSPTKYFEIREGAVCQ